MLEASSTRMISWRCRSGVILITLHTVRSSADSISLLNKMITEAWNGERDDRDVKQYDTSLRLSPLINLMRTLLSESDAGRGEIPLDQKHRRPRRVAMWRCAESSFHLMNGTNDTAQPKLHPLKVHSSLSEGSNGNRQSAALLTSRRGISYNLVI